MTIHTYCNVALLPVVTKDPPVSPRFSPYDFLYRVASATLLQLVSQWLDFTYSRSHAFRYYAEERIHILVFTRNRLTVSALAGVRAYLLDHSGDEGIRLLSVVDYYMSNAL